MSSHPGSDAGNGIADEWIQSALREYEQIASLVNAQSMLGNTAALSSTSAFSSPDIFADGHHGGGGHDVDPKSLTAEIQQKGLHDSLSAYYHGIDAVRKTHASLKAQLSSMSMQHNASDGDGVTQTHPSRRRRPSQMAEAFSRHIKLSERVIRTVMMQTSSAQNTSLCGVLYENGIIRTSSPNDHEVNIVALASLRASVSQLKANFGGSDSS